MPKLDMRPPAVLRRVSSTGQKGRICPACGAPAQRMRRNAWDRIYSLWSPSRRFRCESCDWTGLKPSKKKAASRNKTFKRRTMLRTILLVIACAIILGLWMFFAGFVLRHR